MIEELKKIETIDKILRDREKQAIDSIFLEQTKNSSNNLLSKIRAKIWAGTIENEDIINIEKQKEEIDREQYYLIKIAIYEKLGQKRNALQVIEQIRAEGITIKGITEIRDRLKSKKVAFFDLDKWDQIIGWDVSKTEEYEQEFKKCIEINKNDKFAQDMIEELKKIETIDKILRDREKQAIDSIFLEQTKNSSNNLLSKIRAKIWAGTIENEDIINIEKQKEEIDREQYYLIKIAIYEKLGQKRNALQVIEQIRAEGITIKGITEIRDRLKSKKVAFFDLDKWDQIIGWDVSKTEEYEQELRNVNNTEQNDRLKTQENNIIKTEPPVSSEKVLKPKNRAKERRYVTSEDIAKNNIKPSAKNDEKKQTPKKQKWDNKEITILQTLSYTLKQTIEEINYKYYVEMQPKVTKSILSKEYYDLLQDIGKTNLEEKKRRTKLMQDILKEVYGDGQIREKYVKKYDKLQSILECSSDNKRAKMELILVLINEGYKQVAKIEFGEEYDYIEKIIEQYGKRKMTAKEVKDSIDEYCI